MVRRFEILISKLADSGISKCDNSAFSIYNSPLITYIHSAKNALANASHGHKTQNAKMIDQNIQIPTMADMAARGEEPDILFWVGCAGSFDQRA
ncbi:MAG: hypothetical protein ACXWDO_08455, partial [Bacteroidia bacterium]